MVVLVENRRQVSSAIQNAVDRYGHVGDMKGDGDAAAEGCGPQARPQIVAARAAFREGHQTKAVRDDPISIALRPSGAGIERDVVIELEEVHQGLRCEDDLTRHGWPFFTRSAW